MSAQDRQQAREFLASLKHTKQLLDQATAAERRRTTDDQKQDQAGHRPA